MPLEKPAVVKTGAFSAGFGKTNARAPTVAWLVWPRHYNDRRIIMQFQKDSMLVSNK